MPLDPVKIPQNVYIEDRIVGPLTLKQTIIMTVGGGFSYLLFSMLQKTYGNPGLPLTVIAWTPCAIAVLFALVKVNDLSLLRILFLMIERLNKASTRTWVPRQGVSINIRFSTPSKPDEKPAEPSEQHTSTRIQELSTLIDQPIAGVHPQEEGREQEQPPMSAPTPSPSPTRTPAPTPGPTPLDGIQSMKAAPATPNPPLPPAPTPTTRPQEEQAVTDTHPDSDEGTSFGNLAIFRDVFSPPTP